MSGFQSIPGSPILQCGLFPPYMMLAMVLVWSARKGALSVMNTGAPVKGRWASVCVIYVCNAETGSSWTSNPYRDVSFWIPWKVILAEPLLWNVIWRVVNNCGSSCPEKGLYIILLRAMSEGRNMRFKANRVIALRRSCLMGIFSFGSQERNISETER